MIGLHDFISIPPFERHTSSDIMEVFESNEWSRIKNESRKGAKIDS